VGKSISNSLSDKLKLVFKIRIASLYEPVHLNEQKSEFLYCTYVLARQWWTENYHFQPS